jgi:hypothetical protein
VKGQRKPRNGWRLRRHKVICNLNNTRNIRAMKITSILQAEHPVFHNIFDYI